MYLFFLNISHYMRIEMLHFQTIVPFTHTYPFSEALLAFGLVYVHSFASRNKLHQYYPKGIYISFLRNFSTLSIFWSQVTTVIQEFSLGKTSLSSWYFITCTTSFLIQVLWSYPNVPITLVCIPISPSGCHLASPKSPTWSQKWLIVTHTDSC